MKTKRILALVLAMLLLAGFFPTAPQTAYADDDLSWTDEECPKAKELGYDPPVHLINWETLQQGNCTVETITKVYCTICGRSSITRYAPGHDWDEGVVTKEATCTEAGEITYTCHRLITNMWCGAKRTETIPALGHNWDGGTVTKAATCSDAGVKTYTCTRCGATKTETLAKLAHTPSEAPAVEPTCTEPGHGAGSVCAVCGETLNDAEAYPALGHLWDGGTVTKQPTETEEGEVVYTCQRDPKHTKTQKLPATGTEPKPAAWLSVSWAEDAGKGKCFEGATVTAQMSITNIGNVPIIAGKKAETLQPGEVTTWDYSGKVDTNAVSKQMFVISSVLAFQDVEKKTYHTNLAVVSIPLTYPDGTTPPEPKPSLKLEMIPENAFKDVYPYDDGDMSKAVIIDFDLKVTNTGNVPLDFFVWVTESKSGSDYTYHSPGEKAFQPKKSNCVSWWIGAYSKDATLDPEDSPYYGTRSREIWIVGYEPGANPNTEKPLCESNHITISFKIARPGAKDWELPEDGIVEKFTKTEVSHPSDPNGYQVGERIDYLIVLSYLYLWEEIKGFSDLALEDLNACEAYNEELNQNGHLHYETEPGIVYTAAWHGAYHIVTPEDAESGYVTNTATAKFTDSLTGEPVEMTTNTVTSPVIGKSTKLTVIKALAKPPANGEYYEEGEELVYTIVITNNTDKTYINIEVKDGGGVIATIDKLEPGQSSDPIHYSGGKVTALDQIIAVIKNVATVTATDEDGNKEIITSTEVTAPTDPDGGMDYKPDPDKGNDPMGKIDGVVAGVYISKTETSAPANGSWYQEGETITYTITVKNTGEVEATNIVVRDSLEKGGLGVIETIPSLAPGESKPIAYQHTVTADDVEHGIVINYAAASWQYDGKAGVPVTSEAVKSYTSEEGPIPGVTGGITPPKDDDTTPKHDPNDEIIEDSTGTPILIHPDGSYVSCMLDIQSASDSAAVYTLRHCREHEEVAKAAAELLEGKEDSIDAWDAVTALWLDAVETAYQDLYEASWGDASGALLLAHDRFVAELQYEQELLYASADPIAARRRITEILRLHCAELCHILHGGTPTDSLTNAYAELGGVSPDESCARSIEAGEAEAVYMETYCEGHAEIMAALRANLRRSLSNTAEANSFGTGASMWQKALDTMVNDRYRTADAEGRNQIAKARKGLDMYRQALRPLYEVLYPADVAAPEEAVLRLYRTMAADLCQLW